MSVCPYANKPKQPQREEQAIEESKRPFFTSSSASTFPSPSTHPPLLKELNTLLSQQQQIMNTNGNHFSEYDVNKTTHYFKRRTVFWKKDEILAHRIPEGICPKDKLLPNVDRSAPVDYYSDILEMKLVE
jgi:hypothetical protein